MLHPFEHLGDVRGSTLAALVLLAFLFLAVWSSPLMYGATCARAALPATRPKGRALAWRFALATLAHLPLLAAFAALVGHGDTFHGLLVGLGVGLCFVAPALGATYLLAGRSLRLFLVDAGYYVIFLALAGVVLGY